MNRKYICSFSVLIMLFLVACSSKDSEEPAGEYMQGRYVFDSYEMNVGLSEYTEFEYRLLRSDWLIRISTLTNLERLMKAFDESVRLLASDESNQNTALLAYELSRPHPEIEQEKAYAPSRFSWLEFITQTQFDTAKEYLGQSETDFMDWILQDYVWNVIMGLEHHIFSNELLRYFDNVPFDQNTSDPLRILVRMHEAQTLILIEEAVLMGAEITNISHSWNFGRDISCIRLNQ